MHLRDWLLLALFALLLGIACLLSRRRRRSASAPARPVTGGPALMGLLVSLAALTAGSAQGCKADATGQGGAKADDVQPATKDADGRAAIRTMLLEAMKPGEYQDDHRTSARKARAALERLLAPFVTGGQLSKAGAERVLLLHEECVGHALRSMATCYEPMPADWLDWESGGGDRRKACDKIAKLDELAKAGKLNPDAAAKAKQAIAEGLHALDRLRAFLAEGDKDAKAALKKKILEGQIGTPDAATLEAAGFVLELFETS